MHLTNKMHQTSDVEFERVQSTASLIIARRLMIQVTMMFPLDRILHRSLCALRCKSFNRAVI